jgi:hypothetical protein
VFGRRFVSLAERDGFRERDMRRPFARGSVPPDPQPLIRSPVGVVHARLDSRSAKASRDTE